MNHARPAIQCCADTSVPAVRALLYLTVTNASWLFHINTAAGLLACSTASKTAFPFPVAEVLLPGFVIAAYSDEIAQVLHLFPFSPENIHFPTPLFIVPTILTYKLVLSILPTVPRRIHPQYIQRNRNRRNAGASRDRHR
jgi:hypothetical protein